MMYRLMVCAALCTGPAHAAQDTERVRAIIEGLGNPRRWPQWKAESEFTALREQSAGIRRKV